MPSPTTHRRSHEAEATRRPEPAVAEATRLLAESSRRSADTARAAVQASRSLLDESAEIGRRLGEAWVASTEATLQATFDLQNTSIATSLSFFDTATTTQRAALKQWEEAVRGVQEATLDAFRAQVRAAEQVWPRRA